MPIVERHSSPDGLLKLIVVRSVDGDWSVGFDGLEWHTHGDILTFEYGGDPESAVRAFVDDVLGSQRLIVISRVNGALRNAWITDDPSRDEMKHAVPQETIEKRFWNGEMWGADSFDSDAAGVDGAVTNQFSRPAVGNQLGNFGFLTSLVAICSAAAVGPFGELITYVGILLTFLSLPGMILSALGLRRAPRHLAAWGLAMGIAAALYLPTFCLTFFQRP